MPNKITETQSTRNGFEVPKFAIGNTGLPLATQVNQMVSEVPTGTKASVQSTMFKPTLGSVAKIIKRKTIVANHRLNLPLCEGFTSVKTISKVIEDMADNYQRTHQDAFFEAYPELLILKDGETGYTSTSALRVNYRKFAARIAHYWFHFMNASMMLQGSLANLLSMSRLNGNELFKTVAYETRWSKVNSNTAYFSRIPGVRGVFDYICENMKYAIGTTSFGAEIVSFPLFITDVSGNQGWNAPGFDALESVVMDSTKRDAVLADIDSPSTTADAVSFARAMDKMYATMKQYVGNAYKVLKTVDGRTVVWNPHLPYYKNGGVLRYQRDDQFVKMKMNNTLADVYLDEKWSNSLTDALWNNYFYWQAYIIDNFKDMLDPQNDRYVFAASQLGIIEAPKNAQEMLSAIRNNGNLDMVKDLIPRMTYRKDNHVNSATIIKWSPLLKQEDSDPSFYSPGSFEINFERYDVLNGDLTQALQKAKEWPSIAPATFGDAFGNNTFANGNPDNIVPTPFVFNTIPGIGTEAVKDDPLRQYNDDTNYAIVGKGATFLDVASSRNLDPESTSINTLGITAASAEQYIKNGNGVSFEEDPTTIRLLHQPLIDNSDPYQCGFAIMISSDNPDPSETERFFRTKENFGISEISPSPFPKVPSITVGNTRYLDHVSIPEVLALDKYAFIFMGANIFDHPLLSPAVKGCGSPRMIMDLWGDLKHINGTVVPADKPGSAMFTGMLELATARDITDQNNSFAALVPTAINWAQNGNKVMMQYFDPAYGPIKPIIMDDLVSGIIPVANLANSDGIVTRRYTTAVTPLIADVANDSSPEASQRKVVWDPFDDVGQSWVPFIDSIAFRTCKSDPYVGTQMVSGIVNRIAQKTTHESWSTLLAKVNIQFTGVEDSFPFWSHSATKDAYKIDTQGSISGSTSAMPEEDIMAAPRVERTRTPGKKNDYSSFKSSNPNRQTESSLAKGRFTGSSPKKPSFKKGRDGNSKKYEDGLVNLDGVKSDSKLVSESMQNSLSNTFDPMGSKGDDKVKSKTKKNGKDLSIQTQM